MQDLGLLTGAHASVVNRIAAEAATLDRAIRSGEEEGVSVSSSPHVMDRCLRLHLSIQNQALTALH